MKFKGSFDERQQIKLSQPKMRDKSAPKRTVDAKPTAVVERAKRQDTKMARSKPGTSPGADVVDLRRDTWIPLQGVDDASERRDSGHMPPLRQGRFPFSHTLSPYAAFAALYCSVLKPDSHSR